jgi:hypothetical protein
MSLIGDIGRERVNADPWWLLQDQWWLLSSHKQIRGGSVGEEGISEIGVR